MTAPATSSLSTISVCPLSAAISRGTECGGACGHEEKVTVNVEFMNNNIAISSLPILVVPLFLYILCRYKHNPPSERICNPVYNLYSLFIVLAATFSLGVNTSCWSAMCSWLHTQCLYTLNERHRHLTLRDHSENKDWSLNSIMAGTGCL